FMLNPGQAHACRSGTCRGHSYTVLCIPQAQMKKSVQQNFGPKEKIPFFKGIVYREKTLFKQAARLFEIIKETGPDIGIQTYFSLFVTQLLTEGTTDLLTISEPEIKKKSIKTICDYLALNSHENFSLKKLSDIACLSPFHFQRQFTKSIGISPHEYLMDLKIKKAKKMLLRSQDIADIALGLGFVDQSHFSRMFRKTVGIPPGRYYQLNHKKRH
ncbi:MAG: AraC family transcriptional regulator, partial [Proteobacteria bacterium]|nr:AraC family transcriptional regulator [Pseudomonadota bacterium]